jgi:hypothetical protein
MAKNSASGRGTRPGDSCPAGKAGKAAVGEKRAVEKKAPKKKRSQAEVVKDLLRNAAVKLKKKDSKPSLGEYIRLLQLQKELEAEEPREIRVRWVETEPTFGIEE